MALGLVDSLAALVKRKYNAAHAAGALTLAASELSIINVTGVKYQLRYCPSLAKKPTPQQSRAEVNGDSGESKLESGGGSSGSNSQGRAEKSDPFENPSSELLVEYVPKDEPTHVIVLNKFPIIREHFILATKESKPQTHKLEQQDLGVAYACLKSWEQDESNGKLFAFYNSGAFSGASQPHRHLQFLPAQSLHEDIDESEEWTLLADEICSAPDTETGELSYFRSHRHLPFQHFGTRLPPDPSPMTLHQTYLNLYQQCLAIAQDYEDDHPGKISFHATGGGDLPISYNLALTTKSMVMCPRRAEGLMLTRQDGSDVDFVALNGTMLAGSMMVKSEEAYNMLRQDEAEVEKVFHAIGLSASLRRITSWVHD